MKKGSGTSVVDVAAGLVLAEFDIDKGSCVRAVYPARSHANKSVEGQESKTAHSSTDNTSLLTAFHRVTADSEELACNMLPDGAEKLTLTRTVFIANRPWKGQVTRFPVYHFVLAKQVENVEQADGDNEHMQTNLKLSTLSNEELCNLEWKLAANESKNVEDQHSTNMYNNVFTVTHDALKQQKCNLLVDAAHHVAALYYNKDNDNAMNQKDAHVDSSSRRNNLPSYMRSTIHSENVRLLTSIPHSIQHFHDKLTQDCLEKNGVATQSKNAMEHESTSTLMHEMLLLRQLLAFVFVVVEFDSGAINGLLMHSLHYSNLIELLKVAPFTSNASLQNKKNEMDESSKCVVDVNVNAESIEYKRVLSEHSVEIEQITENNSENNNRNDDDNVNADNKNSEIDKLQSNVESTCDDNKELESNDHVCESLPETIAEQKAIHASHTPPPPLQAAINMMETSSYEDINRMLSEFNEISNDNIILYGLCAVVSKRDSSSRRGGITKSIAVLGTSLSLLEPFWPILVQATQYCCDVPHTDSDAIEQQRNVLKLCYRTINSISARVSVAKGEINPLRYQVMSLCSLNRCNAAEVIYRDAPFGTTVRATVQILSAAHEITFTRYNLERLVNEFGVYFVHLLYAVLTEQRIIILSRAQQQQQQHLTEVCEVALSLGVIGSMLSPYFIPEKVFPYASVNNAGAFMHVPGYIAGTVNPIFADEARWNWDVLCDLDYHTISLARSAKTTKKNMTVTTALANAIKMGESAVELLGSLGSNTNTASNSSNYCNNNNNNKDKREYIHDMMSSNVRILGKTTSSSSSSPPAALSHARNAISTSHENSTESFSKDDNVKNDMNVTTVVEVDSSNIYNVSRESVMLHKELLNTIYHMRATQVAVPDRHRRLQLKLEEFVQVTTLLSIPDVAVDSIVMSLLQPTFNTAVMITLRLQMQLCSFISHAQAHILFHNEPSLLLLCCAALRRCNRDEVNKLLHLFDLLLNLLISDEAVLWLLRRMPSALDGLNPIAIHLTHSTFAVRLTALKLLKRIEEVPEGKSAIAAMSSFLVIIYENCINQRGANTNVENYNNNSISNDNNNNNVTITNDCNVQAYNELIDNEQTVL